AFSFGGTKTPVSEMPTTATASYKGAYGATVKSWNWATPDTIDPEIGNINPNGLFMVNGLAEIQADFGAATINGTLTPTSWKFAGTDYWYYYDVIDNSLYTRGADNTANYVTQGQFVPAFFNTKTYLSGPIAGNSYSGKAKLGDGFVSADNPMYGAFFGAGARETTGIFSVLGVTPQPMGGEYPINDDRRAYVQQSGVFNAQCQAGGACTP
ncbi:MAG: transferrin-binding protein-like solute binding protein, partial [Rhizobiales bacterium]|nr:transferrin-binding protein-like solute binding protein [Hyphomicrobiales bacterium]